MAIPNNPEQKLRRSELAAALSEAGYPTAKSSLATMATRGNGPCYQLFGRIPLYVWKDGLAWAESRLSKPRSSSSEADQQQAA